MPPLTPLATLRERLVRLGYHAPVHASFLAAERGTPEERLAQAMEATDDGRPLATALRLFMLGVPVVRSEAAACIGAELVAALVERGLLRAEGESMRAAFAVVFVGEAAAAQDFVAWREADEQEDFVAPIAGATRILSLFAVPTPGGRGRLLEIGTGQGFPVAVAAAQARVAVATDISPRALLCAGMTAELNGRANIERREGSLFEPLRPDGETFDTIISNPPFVITPTGVTSALSSGGGDAEFTERVVRGVPRFLAEGGFATILGNWGHGPEWAAPVRAWVEGTGCDALAFQIRQETPRSYAQAWRREMRILRPFREPPSADSWRAMFEERGIAGISFGMVVLRRRAGANWFVAQQRTTAGVQAGAGAQLRRLFDSRTRLEQAATPMDLLTVPAKLCPSVELAGRPSPRGRAEWSLTDGTLRQTEGWPEPIAVDAGALAVLFGCDGRRPLRAVIAGVAEAWRTSPQGLERMLAKVMPRWFELGYLY
ncbi:MAG: methyltransferase [Phycisphaerales bacterium]